MTAKYCHQPEQELATSFSTSSNNDNSDNKMTKKTVTFSEDVNIRPTLHLSDYTAAEMDEAFYEGDEIGDFKKAAKRIAQRLDKKQSIEYEGNDDDDDDDSQCTTRGVEWMTQAQSNRRHETRKSASFAVISEQLWADPTNGHDIVAKAYEQISITSLALAQAIGLADEMYVKNNIRMEPEETEYLQLLAKAHFEDRLERQKRREERRKKRKEEQRKKHLERELQQQQHLRGLTKRPSLWDLRTKSSSSSSSSSTTEGETKSGGMTRSISLTSMLSRRLRKKQ